MKICELIPGTPLIRELPVQLLIVLGNINLITVYSLDIHHVTPGSCIAYGNIARLRRAVHWYTGSFGAVIPVLSVTPVLWCCSARSFNCPGGV